MTLKDLVKKLQRGLGVTDDGDFGPITQAATEKYDISFVLAKKTAPATPPKDEPKPVPLPVSNAPWLDEAKKHSGKKETDAAFQAYMNPWWKKIGLPNFKGLSGSARAWCALFVFMAMGAGGYQTGKLNASAISGDNVGVAINYKKDGIPRGAIVRINHGSNCKTSSGNHIGFSEGDCTVEDLKSGSFNMFGGNQGDQAKVSSFPVNDICSVRWPDKDEKGNAVPFPAPVLKSNGCKGKYSSAESTR